MTHPDSGGRWAGSRQRQSYADLVAMVLGDVTTSAEDADEWLFQAAAILGGPATDRGYMLSVAQGRAILGAWTSQVREGADTRRALRAALGERHTLSERPADDVLYLAQQRDAQRVAAGNHSLPLAARGAPDAAVLVADAFPAQGPYRPDYTASAARLLVAALRYLLLATRERDGLPDPPVIHQVLTELFTATGESAALIRRITEHLRGQATRPALQADGDPGDAGPAGIALNAVARLNTAAAMLHTVTTEIAGPVLRGTCRLYLADAEDAR